MDGQKVLGFIETQGMNLLRGLVVLAVGCFLVHWLMKLIGRSEKYVRIEATLKGFLGNLIKLVLYLLVILTAANVVGIPLTSIVTLIGTAGVAVSLAMQGALSNLVGGATLLLLKPIRVGEYVKIGDYEGTVKAIGAFYTDVITFDNRHICLPNSALTNTAIVNFTREGTRRLEVVYCVSYQADMDRVFAVLMEVARGASGVLPDPAPEALTISPACSR